MKNISTYMPYLPKSWLSLAVALLLTGVISVGGVMAAFGPDRPTKEYLGSGTSGFDHVTFNSFTNAPNIGDERDFLRGKVDGGTDLLDPISGLDNGDHVKVYMYVHNGADPSLNESGDGIAQDLTARVQIPSGMNTTQDLVGFISASNAQPQEIFDTLTINGSEAFEVNYVAGSAQWTTNAGTFDLSDEIVGSGVSLGDDNLDGTMPGCFEYAGWVTFEIEVKSDEKEQPEPIVSCDALTASSTAIKPGQTVDFTAKASAENADITKYVFDFGDGENATVNTSDTTANASHTYNQAGEFNAKVTVHFDADGVEITKSGDKCAVTITADKDEPPVEPPAEELPNTGIGGVISGVFGTGALGMSVRSWLESRSMLRAGALRKEG